MPSVPPGDGDVDQDVDHAALGRLRGWGGDALVMEMSAIFFEDAPGLFAAARVGAASGDAEAVRRAMHAVKSSAGQLGAARAHRLADEAVRCARAGELAGLPAMVDAAERALDDFRRWLVTTLAS